MDGFYKLITEKKSLAEACEELYSEEVLGFDCETTELEPRDGKIRLLQLSGSKNTYVIDLKGFEGKEPLSKNKDLDPLRKVLFAERPIKVAHNAKFDSKWVAHHLGTDVGGIFDTMLASQLISAGERDRRHGLADVSAFFLGIEVDKSEQVSDWNAAELSESQIRYAAKDAAIMAGLRNKLLERLRADGLDRVADLENRCVMAIAKMELNGFFLDRDSWLEHIEELKMKREGVVNELQEMLSSVAAQANLFGVAEINLDSPSQVSDALRQLGVPIENSTSAGQLEPFATDFPAVAILLEYLALAKSLSSFGENFLEFIREDTGRIHSDFRQIGAPTGRFSSSNPNVQQIPHQDVYRRCFKAPAGRKLVIADYSQIELRILAEFSDDEAFIESFVSGKDFHTATAAQVFDVMEADVTPEQRSFAKRLNFGVVYGIGASRFAAMTGLTVREAEDTLRRYFTTYPGLDEWLRNAAKRAVSDRVSRTASGRMMKFSFDPDDRSAVGAAGRNAKNFPIQGTSADILKRALGILHADLRGTSGFIVNTVHDEILVECDERDAETVLGKLTEAMESAAREFLKKVPVKIDARISDDWSK
jgi:DNA polymerase-1